jgi:23S rRNA (guanine2445-N2)-methyltransferase / 23S rRNA (guanine2069-N7)-methyltransferase
MAGDAAPGLRRSYFGFLGWSTHARDVWKRLVDEAHERRSNGLKKLPPIIGYDTDSRAVRAALANVDRAGLRRAVHIERRDLAHLAAPASSLSGLVITDPPYGERLGEIPELKQLYRLLGEVLIEEFSGWKVAVLTAHEELAKAIGLRAVRVNTLYNGALECLLVQFSVVPERIFKNVRGNTGQRTAAALSDHHPLIHQPTAGAEMLANRLRKNLRSLGRWAQRNRIYCYRVYDADIPEYAVAIDIYENQVYVQEYEAPKTIDPDKARARLADVGAVVPEVLKIVSAQMFFRVRRRQKGQSQYHKRNAGGSFQEVREDTFKFLVNFTDYIDTGLFLDHRLTRALLRELARGKRFLNLFAYTGTATVYAAGGGATATASVDSSNTYLSWAQKNLALNGYGGRDHQFIRADCLDWLRQDKRTYGLIFLDPPTFSNAKDRTTIFDLQRDYIELVHLAARHLDQDGVLIFSNNYRRFKMDSSALAPLNIEDITASTIPKDFASNPRIHKCWKITRI